MARTKQRLIIAVLAILIIAQLGFMLQRRNIGRNMPPPPPVAAPVPPTPPAAGAKPPAQTVAGAPQKPQGPLPTLVPGNTLTDEKFAQTSAKIVAAVLGLKKDQDWEVNVVACMAKVLKEDGVSEDQYRQYAEALNKNPDRGRAVAENIIRKAEKKLGYRIDMKNLPMFKFDQQKIDQINRRLK